MLAAVRRKAFPARLHPVLLYFNRRNQLTQLGIVHHGEVHIVRNVALGAKHSECRALVVHCQLESEDDGRKDPGRAELTHEYLTNSCVVLDLPLETGGSLQVTSHTASEHDNTLASTTDTIQEWRVLRFKPADGVSDLLQSVSKVLIMPPDCHGPRVRQRPEVLSLAYTKSFVSVVLAVLNLLAVPVLLPMRLAQGISKEQRLRILCIGLGAGSVPSFLAYHLPHCEVEVVELESAVLRAATEMGFVPETGRLSVKVGDGAAFALHAAQHDQNHTKDGVYDAVLIDAYDAAGNVPQSLYSMHSPIAHALKSGLLRKRGSLIATNFLPSMDLSEPLGAYGDALPADCAGVGFSIQAEGSGNLIAVQVCGGEPSKDTALLAASLRQSAADVGRGIDCCFDMSMLAARNLRTWPAELTA